MNINMIKAIGCTAFIFLFPLAIYYFLEIEGVLVFVAGALGGLVFYIIVKILFTLFERNR